MIKPNIARLFQGYWRQDPIWRGLIGAWFMPEGRGLTAYDYSGYSNHGVLTNMASPPSMTSGWNIGKFGYTLAFDGINDYIQIADANILEPVLISACTWFYPNGLQPNDTHYRRLWNKTYNIEVVTPYISYGFLFDGAGDDIAATLTGNNNPVIAIAKTPITINTWQFVCFTFDGTTVRIYMNGVEKAKESSFISYGTGNLVIGQSYGTGVGRFNGFIDAICIFNRVLSSNEVMRLYSDSFPDVRRRVWFVQGFKPAWNIRSTQIIQPGISYA